jgi:hypothetical protein
VGTSYLNIILDDDFDPSANQIAKILADTNAQVSILDTKGSTGRNAVIVAGQRIDFAMPSQHRELSPATVHIVYRRPNMLQSNVKPWLNQDPVPPHGPTLSWSTALIRGVLMR